MSGSATLKDDPIQAAGILIFAYGLLLILKSSGKHHLGTFIVSTGIIFTTEKYSGWESSAC